MGPYLSTPIRDKESETGHNATLRWAACSMQGWRKQQEDAHIADTTLTDGNAVFAVFDGHGGKEVSIYVKNHFVKELVKSQMYKQRNYESALKETFHRMDEMLLTP